MKETVASSEMSMNRYCLKTSRILSISYLLGWITSALAGLSEAEGLPTPMPNNGAQMNVSQQVFDFGKVSAGEVIAHDFVFTNTGNQLLVINDVHTSCGCTTAKDWSHEIPPGKQGIISINLETINVVSGPVTKSITVACNDTNHPVVTLQMAGTVWRAIELSPQSANFTGPLDSLSNLSRTIRIMNQDKQPLTLSSLEPTHQVITAQLETNQPGKEYLLRVTLVPPLGAGNLFGQVRLKTSNPKFPTLQVPVFAIARPAVMVIPSHLELPSRPTNKLQRIVSVRNNAANPLKLSDPAVNAKGVELSMLELQPGQSFSLVLNFPEYFRLAKGESVELTFKSNHPQFPLLRVPIVQR